MRLILLMLTVFAYRVICFTIGESTKRSLARIPSNLQVGPLGQIKYSGKGFGEDLQAILSEAIQDAAIYYKDSNYAQSNYISKQLNKKMPGCWHVLLIVKLNISKITEVSTGFSYWNDNDTWALWYNTSSFAKNVMHLLIFNGQTDKTIKNVSTNDTTQGNDIPSENQTVINNIVQSLHTAQEISKYIQKFDGQKWSVISIPFSWGGDYPEVFAAMTISNTYMTYHKSIKISDRDASAIIYV